MAYYRNIRSLCVKPSTGIGGKQETNAIIQHYYSVIKKTTKGAMYINVHYAKPDTQLVTINFIIQLIDHEVDYERLMFYVQEEAEPFPLRYIN